MRFIEGRAATTAWLAQSHRPFFLCFCHRPKCVSLALWQLCGLQNVSLPLLPSMGGSDEAISTSSSWPWKGTHCSARQGAKTTAAWDSARKFVPRDGTSSSPGPVKKRGKCGCSSFLESALRMSAFLWTQKRRRPEGGGI
jgi:hypothetical protein